MTVYTPPFHIRIAFDWPANDIAIGETPYQDIWDSKMRHVMQLAETPILPGSRAICEDGHWRWEGRWSTDVADWQPGPFALKMVELLTSWAEVQP